MVRKKKLSRKGLSEMIGYALLVALALGLGIMVYAWMKSVAVGNVESCPDDVSIILSKIECQPGNKFLNLTFLNKGLFNVDGWYVKASNGSKIAVHPLRNSSGSVTGEGIIRIDDFKPGMEGRWTFNYTNINKVNSTEVSPFIKNKKNKIIVCTKAVFDEAIIGCT